MNTAVDGGMRYICKGCGGENVWKVNQVRQRGKAMLLRDGDDGRYDVYLLLCQTPGCGRRRRIKVLRKGV